MGEIDTGRVTFTKTDGPEFPKMRTRRYILSLKELNNSNSYIRDSGSFGVLDERYMGSHPIELKDINYSFASRRGFIGGLRTAVKDNGEPLSQGYFFKRGEIPLNIFLLVRVPWANIIRRKKKDEYLVQAYARSPEKAILPTAILDLEEILNTFKID